MSSTGRTARTARPTARTLLVISLAAVLGLLLSACDGVIVPGWTPGIPTTTAAPPPTTTAPGNPAGWRLIGGDEFNGSSLDPSKWRAYHNTYGDGNLELACLTPNNLAQSGGALHIVAKKETTRCPNRAVDQYSSGFIGSREAGTYYPRYARFEMRARLPHAQGLWPGFWLRHVNGAGSAEVDIMEYFHSQVPGKTTQTLHLDGVQNVSKKTSAFEAPTANAGWHTWAVDILPDPSGVRFTFLLDGTPVSSYVDTKHRWSSADPSKTWDVAVNMSVGGRWTGAPDDTLGLLRDLNRCAQGGTAPSGCKTTGIRRVDWNNPASSTYDVDYVRVYAPA